MLESEGVVEPPLSESLEEEEDGADEVRLSEEGLAVGIDAEETEKLAGRFIVDW